MKASTGQWVEIGWTALTVGDRAETIPESTKMLPLYARVKGFALDAGEVGEQVRVETVSGRILQGELLTVDPTYSHSFGKPQPELLSIGRSLREEVR